MIIPEDNYLEHYGKLRRSGRYPWGSGEDEPEMLKHKNFLEHVATLKKQGLSDTEIAKGLGLTRNELQDYKSISRNAIKAEEIATAYNLKYIQGYSNIAIGKEMGKNESSVRSLLTAAEQDRANKVESIASMLKDQVDTHEYIDVGKGVENHLGITKDKLRTAVTLLKEQGYVEHKVQVDQLGTGGNQKTLIKVLCKPGTEYLDVKRNRDKIRMINEKSEDQGLNFLGLLPPIVVNPNRIGIKYGDEGGSEADGLIYVRPGVKDLSLGTNHYAQVRIAVEGDRYLKGMAIYKDDLPKGVDLQFNTNKLDTGNKLDAMKKYSDDPENPFGSLVDQIKVTLPNGKEQVTSAMNLVNEQADWEKWNKSLSSQMLSKQKPTLAKTQLDLTYEQKNTQLQRILSLTNPTVKRKLLEEFADSVDSSSVHLKAAHMPRQQTQVIIPIKSLKDNEIYAPNFRAGERVALIRYPHGGTFEIPELTVNNRNPEAKKLLGQATAAVGINANVAKRMSGADFDGDTVLVIPNNNGAIHSSPALKGLANFDPQGQYPGYEGMNVMKPRTTQIEMGKISNLITDMTIKGANPAELARAVRHSMVVIDAEKHKLNYKQSAVDNGILQLKKKYQTNDDGSGGASTLLSRKKSQTVTVPERKPTYRVDKVTGKKIPIETGNFYVDKKTGQTIFLTQKVNRLAEVDDAHELSSGTPMEKIYADHSNRLKALANTARLEAVNTPPLVTSPSAKVTYAKQVAKLNADLNIALKNAPLERRAQLLANATVQAKRDANPNMEKKELKKIEYQALAEARRRLGASKQRIFIEADAWEAIQAGAISNSKLSEILNNADMDQVKKLASPKIELKMTAAKRNRAQAMYDAGWTQAEIADTLGVSLTTLKEGLNG